MNIYQNRRSIVAKDMPDNSTLVLFSNDAVAKSNDQKFPFVIDRNFYYLTGVEQEHCALVLNKTKGVISEQFFSLPFNEVLAKWVGGRLSKQRISEISGVNIVRDYEELTDYFGQLYNSNRSNDNYTVYFDLWHYSFNQVNNQTSMFVEAVKNKYQGLNIKDSFVFLTPLRLVKDNYEVECLKQATSITKRGIEQIMKSIAPNMSEMTIEGLFNFVLAQNNCKENSFGSIVASGKNATILHYEDNNSIMQDNDLLLLDLGATYNHYCSDVSRTIPINGTFTLRQKELYQVVLQAQKIVEANAKPGVTLKQLNQMVVDYYTIELPKHGLNENVSKYYYHNVSHQIGLDVHDVDGGFGQVLQPGMVISNEPGLYIEEEGIGIRIEDDLLITGLGCENLSKDIIKEIGDIEEFMKK